MNVYLDTSVALRRLFHHPTVWSGWGRWRRAFSSVLLRVECLRTIERLRLEGRLDDEKRVLLHQDVALLCDTLTLVPLADEVLQRAAQSFPTILGTLDALHLSSAVLVREQEGHDLVVSTHDLQLGRAAEALGFTVEGLATVEA